VSSETISVLYVDDEPALLDVGKQYLELSDTFKVRTAQSAAEAIRILSQQSYDCIISDYQMPETSGIDLLEQVRSENHEIPFILFTGKGREDIVIRAFDAGVDFYVQKGGDSRSQFRELSHKIRRAVEKRLMETELRASEERYRSMVEDQTEFICRFRPDGTHIFVNDAYCRYFGKVRDEIIGSIFIPVVPDEDREILMRHFRSLTREKPVSVIDHRIIMPDGSIRWQRWSDRAIFGNDGAVTEYMSVGRDITETKELEIALRARTEELHRNILALQQKDYALHASEEKIRELVASIPGIVYRLYLQEPRHMEFLNSEVTEYTGYSRAELTIGDICSIDPLIVEEDRSRVIRNVKSALVTGRPFETEYRIRKKDGSVRSFIERGRPVAGKEGRPGYIDGVIFDVTDRRLTEQSLRLANAKLNLLSGITRHDILNLLMALKGYIELSGQSIQDRDRLAHFIEKERIIAGMIENQINFTGEYQDIGQNDPAWQNIGNTAQRVGSRFPTLAVTVGSECFDFEILADPLFCKVIKNLLDNAGRHGGKTVSRFGISLHRKGSTLVICCEDDGRGLTPEERAHLFQRGTGTRTQFGLFLCREILSITGLTIAENSQTGNGARFEITVPAGKYRHAGGNQPG
jgi:PAS domain S-box-containing protein